MNTTTSLSSQENIKKLGELIKGIKFAMFTTRDEDGQLKSRPMVTQNADFSGELWFFTSIGSHKVDELKRYNQVNVAYSEPNDQRYISVSGRAEIVREQEKMAELWSDVYKAFFPKGLQDPDLCLLKVSVEEAEYWDSPSGALVQLVGFAKALLTGKRADDLGEHQRLH
jgi:general stress protein 26